MQQEAELKLTQEALEVWLKLPSTNQVLKFLRECKQLELMSMSQGATLSLKNSAETIQQTALAVGMLKGIDLTLELPEYLKEMKREENEND
jgi:hypothetical protein